MKATLLAPTCLLAVSSTVLAADPTARQVANCKIKVAKAIQIAGQAVGMGRGVGHSGGVEIVSKKTNEDGVEIYTLSGGVLSGTDVEGYISGSGATTTVRFFENSCKIVTLKISTGADFDPGEGGTN